MVQSSCVRFLWFACVSLTRVAREHISVSMYVCVAFVRVCVCERGKEKRACVILFVFIVLWNLIGCSCCCGELEHNLVKRVWD